MRSWQNGPRPEFDPVVFRTDYSDEAAWREVLGALRRPWGPGGGIPDIELYLVDDPAWNGVPAHDVVAAVAQECNLTVVFVADLRTITSGDHALLALTTLGAEDLDEDDYAALVEFGRQFRVLPRKVAEINSNLAVGNLQFAQYAGAAHDDAHHTFRGF